MWPIIICLAVNHYDSKYSIPLDPINFQRCDHYRYQVDMHFCSFIPLTMRNHGMKLRIYDVRFVFISLVSKYFQLYNIKQYKFSDHIFVFCFLIFCFLIWKFSMIVCSPHQFSISTNLIDCFPTFSSLDNLCTRTRRTDCHRW